MQETRNKVLIVQPVVALAQLYQSHLEKAGYRVDVTSCDKDALDLLSRSSYALILVDSQIQQAGVQSILAMIRDEALQASVLLIAAQQEQSFISYMMKKGVHDYLIKPVSDLRLVTSVTNILEQAKMRTMLKKYDEESDVSGFHGLIGSSVAMQTVYKSIRHVAGSDSPVHIKGEIGTDKLRCAEAIHTASPRASMPFVAVDCAAIQNGLDLNVTLFGETHVNESLLDGEKSVIRKAAGGTLFLNNVNEMPLKTQHKLLDFIQTGKLKGHGLSSSEENLNVRLITGVSSSLKSDVYRGTFMAELYTHLSMLPLSLPALRDRGTDVISIANQYLQQMADQMGTSPISLTPAIINKLKEHNWPGNNRELYNWLNSLVNQSSGMGRSSSIPPFRAVDTEDYMTSNVVSIHLQQAVVEEEFSAHTCKLEEFERWIIESRIRAKGGSIPKAAESLGISPSTIYRKRESWVKNLDVAVNE